MADEVDYILHKYQFFFTSEEELYERRNQALLKYIAKYNAKADIPKPPQAFLDVDEQTLYLLDWQQKMAHFCKHYQPQLPYDVLATGSQIFKRFYINNTVMEYHPRIIAYACLFLACKLEKLYVSIIPFLGNIPRQLITETEIKACETLIIDKLSCNLCFFSHHSSMDNHLDYLRQIPSYSNIDCYTYAFGKFSNAMIFSDVWLLHNPAEIAIAVIIDGAAEFGVNIESDVLGLMCAGSADFDRIVAVTRRIRTMAHQYFECRRDYMELNRIEAKLEATHTTDNLPYSIQSDIRAATEWKTGNRKKVLLPLCGNDSNNMFPSLNENCDFKTFILPILEKKDHEIEPDRFIPTEDQNIDFDNFLLCKENDENDEFVAASHKEIELPAAGAPNWLYPMPGQVQLPDSMFWVRMSKDEDGRGVVFNYNYPTLDTDAEPLPELYKNDIFIEPSKVDGPMPIFKSYDGLKPYDSRDLEGCKENVYDLKSMLTPIPKKKENSLSSLDLEDIKKQNQDFLETKMLMEVSEEEEFDLLDLNKLLTFAPQKEEEEEHIDFEPRQPLMAAPKPKKTENDDIFDFKQLLMKLPKLPDHEFKQ